MYYKKRKESERDFDCTNASLCWKCINAVPNRDGTIGCSWTINLKPVKGWEAEESFREYKVYGVYNKTTKQYILNQRTGNPLQFASRQGAERAIPNMTLHSPDDRLCVRILKTDKRISYKVKTCPEFMKG
jgi:hypothetical protein